jgi:hypothetical protein
MSEFFDENYKITEIIDAHDLKVIEHNLYEEIEECSDELFEFIQYLIDVAGNYAFIIRGNLKEHERISQAFIDDEDERFEMGMREMWGEQ